MWCTQNTESDFNSNSQDSIPILILIFSLNLIPIFPMSNFHSNVLIPISMHLIPISIPWPIDRIPILVGITKNPRNTSLSRYHGHRYHTEDLINQSFTKSTTNCQF